MNSLITTRFAPSPTGDLHIGGARTLFFNYLLAKKYNGKLILRIEDTDFNRNKSDSVLKIYNDINWLGLLPDESCFNPNSGKTSDFYVQSKRVSIYKKYANFLINNNKAYYCFCSKNDIETEKLLWFNNFKNKAYQYSKKCLKLSREEINEKIKKKNEFVIRIKISEEKEYKFKDIVRGNITFSTKEVEDFVLIRNSGLPTYNFSCVIDDNEMKITHIIRGVEHLTNTNKQIIIYDFFNWNLPEFVHLSIITDKEGKKISKRENNNVYLQTVSKIKNEGYLPQAFLNYLFLLGWNPRDKKNIEFFSLDEMINIFNVNNFVSSPAVYSVDKLNWYNKHYISSMSEEDFITLFYKFYDNSNDEELKKELVPKIVLLYKNKINNFKELSAFIKEIKRSSVVFSLEEKNILEKIKFELNKLTNWTEKNIKEKLEEIFMNCDKEIKKQTYHKIRKVIIGFDNGPEISKLFFSLGFELIIKFFNV